MNSPLADPDTTSDQTVCTVCGHDLSRHDAASERFCVATQARALTRACICR